MVLEFLCPQGHKIHCPAEKAGQAAKCPKCGEKFLIPELSDLAAQQTGGSHADLDISGVTASQDSAIGRSSEQVEFLCPNGHRLWASARLQGKPGQCPECGSKFHVPGGNGSDVSGGAPNSTSSGLTLTEADLNGAEAKPPRPAQRSFPALFAKLWKEKEAGASLEIHIDQSGLFVPEQFLEHLSSDTHAVFASRDEDGSHTLTAMAWTAMRVIVRGIQELP